MKKVDLEIKRILSLLESQISDVKPLLNEQSTGEKQMSPENILTRAKETGCLTNKGATEITDIMGWQAKYLPLVNKNNLTQVNTGDPYIKFSMKDKDGFPGQFYLFGKRGKGPEGTLYLLQRVKTNTVFDPSAQGFEKPHFTEHALRCKEFELTKSDISQDVKLTADQIQRRDDILKSGVIESGFPYTTERPTSGIGKRYIPVDLSTGIGSDGKQYIKKTAVDNLKTDFPTPNKFFIWVDLGTEVKDIDVPAEVEALLKTMGYTRQRPKPGTKEARETKSLKELCKGGDCDDVLLQYANEIEGDREIWPMNEKQKEEARTQGINVSDYKSFVATSAGGREARKAAAKIQTQYADKDSCRAAITVLHACMKSNDNSQCADTINATYSQNYKGTENGYFDTLLTLKQLVKKCESVKLTGLIGGKNYESMRDELRKSTSQFSPYGTAEKRDISLEESLTRNIRSTIKEHARKNMSSRKNL